MIANTPLAGKSAALRIIQISDCHVCADSNALYRGQNADRNFQEGLRLVTHWDPVLILLSGDVSEDGSRESYERTSGLLAQTGVPVLALPGNHDEPNVMKQYFPLGPWDGPYVMEMGNWRLVLLDSTEAGGISGHFSSFRLQQIQSCLQDTDRQHTLLALHHQPLAVGAQWIDRYMLETPEQFFEVTDRSSQVRCICWGHVHQDFQTQRKGVSLLGAPSTVANTIPGMQRFTLDPVGPACRWLELSRRGEVHTGVLHAG